MQNDQIETSVDDRVVVAAACRLKNGAVICGARHFDMVMHSVIALLPEGSARFAEQGFIDNRGEYLNREDALLLARTNGQLDGREKHGPDDMLFSEDVW